jgi:anti-sigma factor RsiW
MNCERMGVLLLAVVDGRATPEERERVSAHVAGCEVCARKLDEMGATWSALDALPTADASAWFETRLRARMAEMPAGHNWAAWLPGSARWAAVVALVAIALWFSVRPPILRRAPATNAQSQEDFAVIKNLPELENYDVISNFEALSALPGAQSVGNSQQTE